MQLFWKLCFCCKCNLVSFNTVHVMWKNSRWLDLEPVTVDKLEKSDVYLSGNLTGFLFYPLFPDVFTAISACIHICLTLHKTMWKSVFVYVHAMNIYYCLLITLKKVPELSVCGILCVLQWSVLWCFLVDIYLYLELNYGPCAVWTHLAHLSYVKIIC